MLSSGVFAYRDFVDVEVEVGQISGRVSDERPDALLLVVVLLPGGLPLLLRQVLVDLRQEGKK